MLYLGVEYNYYCFDASFPGAPYRFYFHSQRISKEICKCWKIILEKQVNFGNRYMYTVDKYFVTHKQGDIYIKQVIDEIKKEEYKVDSEKYKECFKEFKIMNN